MNNRQHIESYMRTRARSIQAYDWYMAGRNAGTAPSEWDMIKYGRDTAMGWLGTGNTSMDESIGYGFDAMYRYAYDDIRDTITKLAGNRRPAAATSEPTIYSLSIAHLDTSRNVYDTLDWIARANLTADQQRIVVLYSLGWRLSEISDDLGLAATSVRRWFKQALPILEDTHA